MTKRFRMFVVFLLLGSSRFLFAGEVQITVGLTPAGSFTATSGALKVGAIKTMRGAFLAKDLSLDLNTISTGIKLRDKHMKEKYFETAKFPRATMDKVFGRGGKFTATLTIRDVPVEVKGTYTISEANVTASFKCQMKDFKIKKPKYLGVGAENEVDVTAILPLPVRAVAAAPKEKAVEEVAEEEEEEEEVIVHPKRKKNRPKPVVVEEEEEEDF